MNGNISGLTVERSPEKAGVGGSSPSLATMFSIAYSHPKQRVGPNWSQNLNPNSLGLVTRAVLNKRQRSLITAWWLDPRWATQAARWIAPERGVRMWVSMPEDQAAQEQQQPPAPQISLREFLEKVPPGGKASVQGLAKAEYAGSAGGTWYPLVRTEIELHCDEDTCNGPRLFEPCGNRTGLRETEEVFLSYRCRNCQRSYKIYALQIIQDEKVKLDGEVYKFGEFPPFGSPTPARVITILGREREYYLKGRRAEFQGMGIGAFAYYRRVVENQKNRLLDEIIRVAQRIDAPQEMLDDLASAKNETQFSTAVGAVKHGIPTALLVNGHNPLTLLHTALSRGLHEQDDEKCLALAESIRTVLADLADRLGHALKERNELNAAVSRLMNPYTED
jgi:hypothetical protein